ncbi:aspartic proteinase nepenthesin-2-like [Prunus avium]|uniref:Aspartic proteinase nepenthesin-2-like n=1 Tax=Prunus avium TaxID=42229 RepID=A0A6P5S2T8_PRUAV|nr:aspartic proteinase nepenthesin-2-like [Prunus avium]
MDTGSDVIWIKCLQSSNVFNPAESSSYSYYSCDSPSCNDLGASGNTCGGRDFCEPCYYVGEYVDGSTTRGTLSHDKFAFEGSKRELVDVGHLDFGCSKYSSWEFTMRNQEAGYILDQKYKVLILRGAAKLHLIKEEKAYYYVTLNGISIGDQDVPLPDGIFRVTSDGEGGFVIDSGTTYTMLRSEAYDVFVTAMHKAIRLPQRRDLIEWFEQCFEGSFEDLDSAGPDVTFLFYGVQVMLTKQTTYIEVEHGLSLAIIRSSEKLSTVGNIQLRNYFVGYDLEQGVVSFAPVDCATF